LLRRPGGSQGFGAEEQRLHAGGGGESCQGWRHTTGVLHGPGRHNSCLTTGALVSGSSSATKVPVTATVGAKNATVVYSIASPGYAGLYQVAVTVPEGVTGDAAIVITQGTTKSNTVSVPVQ